MSKEVREGKERVKSSLNTYDENDSGLLDIKIDLGNGIEEHLIMCEGDTEEDIAKAFCAKHRMTPQQRALLTLQIKKALKEQTSSPLGLESNICDDSISENVDIEETRSIIRNIPIMSARTHKFQAEHKQTRKEFRNISNLTLYPKKKPNNHNKENTVKNKNLKEQLKSHRKVQYPLKPSINRR